MKRGEVWLADLGRPFGGEQGGQRPVLIFENNRFLLRYATVVIVPFTGNLHRAGLETCVRVNRGDGGLASESVALCHHIRAIDKKRLLHPLGTLSTTALREIERRANLTLGI